MRVLALGAHADDVEIGASGAILQWIASGKRLDITWCVLSAAGARIDEARASARDFTDGAVDFAFETASFRDGYFPHEGAALKDWFEALQRRVQPDVILTHACDDAHQDHREVGRLTSTAFRNHLTLHYEIPKWDGDLGRPNIYQPLAATVLDRKCALLARHFASQRNKDWFDAETFRGLARLRGVECRAPERYAEAFYLRKAVLG